MIFIFRSVARAGQRSSHVSLIGASGSRATEAL